MAETMDRPGLWLRAGLTGMASGLSMSEALAGLPAGLDAVFCGRLFARAEVATLEVVIDKSRTDGAQD